MGAKKSRRDNAATARRYASVSEEAERLGVGDTIILEAIRENRFPHRRFGRRILLLPSETDDYLSKSGVSVEDALARSQEP